MKTSRGIYWTPRLLSILLICILVMFSYDVIEKGMTGGEIAFNLIINNIPAILLIILLVISWRKEIIGAVSYFGAGLFYIGFVIFKVTNRGLSVYIGAIWSLLIAIPAFIIAILFLINWVKRKNKQTINLSKQANEKAEQNL